jgi:hypothetical protein
MRPGIVGWKWDEGTKMKIRNSCLKINHDEEWEEKRIKESNK